jgi:DNA-binding CsgD family transcriptional regulator
VARRDAASPQRGRDPAAPPGLAEPLTGRELEVLRLLGAANRTEAAARARQLGLIP